MKKELVEDIFCKSKFYSVDEYTEHCRSLTHRLEIMRYYVNAQITTFEIEMWQHEKQNK